MPVVSNNCDRGTGVNKNTICNELLILSFPLFGREIIFEPCAKMLIRVRNYPSQNYCCINRNLKWVAKAENLVIRKDAPSRTPIVMADVINNSNHGCPACLVRDNLGPDARTHETTWRRVQYPDDALRKGQRWQKMATMGRASPDGGLPSLA